MIVCLQGGDENSGVDKDWYEWASDRPCDLGGCRAPLVTSHKQHDFRKKSC